MAAKIKYPVIDGKKECGRCHEWKNTSEFKEYRNHFKYICNDCEKARAKEYRERPEIKSKTRAYHVDYMSNPEHRKQRNLYNAERRKRRDVKDKKNLDRRVWSLEQKIKAIEYKGGQCCICGYSTCTAALDFHHLDPSQKEGYGTGALKSHWTFEKNKDELDKCILVCCRCHRELHAGAIVYET